MITAIIQARTSSKRLPNKVMMDLAGRPVIYQVYHQLTFSKLLDNIILATSLDKSDDPLEYWATDNNVKFFRGDLNNVLKRFYDAAKYYGTGIIVRITADCPLIDPNIVDEVINRFVNDNFDYFSNTNPPTFPDGLDTEVFSFSALEKSYNEAILQSDMEHVTPYIKNHPEIFKIGNLSSHENLENLRWTIDNKEDYEFLSIVYTKLYKKDSFISWKDVLKLIQVNPELIKINAHIQRNEGYLQSIKEDKEIG